MVLVIIGQDTNKAKSYKRPSQGTPNSSLASSSNLLSLWIRYFEHAQLASTNYHLLSGYSSLTLTLFSLFLMWSIGSGLWYESHRCNFLWFFWFHIWIMFVRQYPYFTCITQICEIHSYLWKQRNETRISWFSCMSKNRCGVSHCKVILRLNFCLFSLLI